MPVAERRWDFRLGRLPEDVEQSGGEAPELREESDGATALVLPPRTALWLPTEGLPGNRRGRNINDYTVHVDFRVGGSGGTPFTVLCTRSPGETRVEAGERGEYHVDAQGELCGPAKRPRVVTPTGEERKANGSQDPRVEPGTWHRASFTMGRPGITTYLDGVKRHFVTTVKAPEISKRDGTLSLEPGTLVLFGDCEAEIAVRYAELKGTCAKADEVAAEALAARVFSPQLRDEEDAKRRTAAVGRKLVLADLYVAPTPVYTHTGFLAHFGDADLGGTALGAGSAVASLELLDVAIEHLGRPKAKGGLAEILDAHGFGPPERGVLRSIGRLVREARDLARKSQRAKESAEALLAFVDHLLPRIQKLTSGSHLLVPCGLNDHAFAVLLEKTSATAYTVVVINADLANGLDFHPVQVPGEASLEEANPKIRYQMALVLDAVAAEKVTDPWFWTMLLKLDCGPYKGIKFVQPRDLYERLLPWLTEEPVAATYLRNLRLMQDVDYGPLPGEKAAGAGVAGKGSANRSWADALDWRSPRRSATEYHKSAMEAVHLVSRRLGFTLHQTKQLKCGLREGLLELALRDLGILPNLSTSEKHVLRVAARQCARAAAKLAPFDPPPRALESTLGRVRGAFEAIAAKPCSDALLPLASERDAAASPISDTDGSDDAPLGPLDFLNGDDDPDGLAGPAVAQAALVPVELSLSARNGGDDFGALWRMLRYADWHLSMLATQPRQIKDVDLLKVAFVEQLCLEDLPTPGPVDPGPLRWPTSLRHAEQLDLLLTLDRIGAEFYASVFSLRDHVLLDAKRVLVSGKLAAMVDHVVRIEASDHPSPVSVALRGTHATCGPEFAVQTAALPLYDPRQVQLRRQILGYFETAALGDVDGEPLFHWETGLATRPQEGLQRMLRSLCGRFALPCPDEELLYDHFCDDAGRLLRLCPELRVYRDALFWQKVMLNTDPRTFPKLGSYAYRDAALHFAFRQDQFVVKGFNTQLFTTPLAPFGSELRYPSRADAGFYVNDQRCDTETDVLHVEVLPSFGGALSPSDAELALSFGTEPYLRIPLLLQFLTAEDRVHSLRFAPMRGFVEAALFEPGPYVSANEEPPPDVVPVAQKRGLGTSEGLLLNELRRAAMRAAWRSNVVDLVVLLLQQTLGLDTGDVSETDTVDIILFACRIGCRVEAFLCDLLERQPTTAGPGSLLAESLVALRDVLRGRCVPLLEAWIRELRRGASAPGDGSGPVASGPVGRDAFADEDQRHRRALGMHAHLVLIFRHSFSLLLHLGGELSTACLARLLASAFFVGARLDEEHHDAGSVSIAELASAYAALRPVLLSTVEALTEPELNQVLGLVYDIVTETGPPTVQEARLARGAACPCAWVACTGAGSRGRYRAVFASGAEDTAQLEVNLQLGQLTRNSHVMVPLPRTLQRHHDVATLFGDDRALQASLLEACKHRERYALVGLHHELDVWVTADSRTAPVSKGRMYDPMELTGPEAWIPRVLEPARITYMTPPQIPSTQLLYFAPNQQEHVARLHGVHPKTGGLRIEARAYRDWKTLQVFEVLPFGRRFYKALVYASDARLSHRDLQPSHRSRTTLGPTWETFGAGDPYGTVLDDEDFFRKPPVSYVPALRAAPAPEPVIRRMPLAGGNRSGTSEVYLPPRFLLGSIPEALLRAYDFWEEAGSITSGGGILRGYPRDEARTEAMLFCRVARDGRLAVQRVPLATVAELQACVETLREALFAGHFSPGVTGPERAAMESAALAVTPELVSLVLATRRALLRHQVEVNDLGLRGVAVRFLRDTPNGATGQEGPATAGAARDTFRRIAARAEKHVCAAALAELRDAAAAGSNGDHQGGSRVLAGGFALHRLQDPLAASQGSRLFGIAQTMLRMENLAHLLCWTTCDSHALDTLVPDLVGDMSASVSATDVSDASRASRGSSGSDLAWAPLMLELPRLHLRFAETGGRFHCLDHTGLAVRKAPPPASLRSVLEAIPFAVVLENRHQELRLLVPLLDVRRPDILQMPFSTHLVQLRRGSGLWRGAATSGHFLFRVPTSGTALEPPTATAALYLLALHFLHRDYADVVRLANAAASDLDASPEDQAILGLLEACNSDPHPDATACRLKLSLNTQRRRGVQLPWHLLEELAAYLRKRSHVSFACRLSPEEEAEIFALLREDPASEALLTMADGAGAPAPGLASGPGPGAMLSTYDIALLRNRRLQLLRRDAATRRGGSVAPFEAPPIAWMPRGFADANTADVETWSVSAVFPWRLNMVALAETPDTWHRFMQTLQLGYQPSRSLDGAPLLEIVHEMHAAGESLTGVPCAQGFLFLYELLTGSKRAVMGDTDVSGTAAALAFPGCSAADLARSPLASIIDMLLKVPGVAKALPFFNDDRTQSQKDRGLLPGRSPPLADLLADIFDVLMDTDTEASTLVRRRAAELDAQREALAAAVGAFCASRGAYADRRPRCLSSADLAAREWHTLGQRDDSASLREVSFLGFARAAGTSREAFEAMAEQPLRIFAGGERVDRFAGAFPPKELGLPEKKVDRSLGFSLPHDAAIASPAAEVFMAKLGRDQERFATEAAGAAVMQLRCISEVGLPRLLAGDSSNETARKLLKALLTVETLRGLLAATKSVDLGQLQDFRERLLASASRVDGAEPQVLPFLLRRLSGQEVEVGPETVFSCILSSDLEAELQRLNPYLPEARADEVLHLAVLLLCVANRVGHLNRALAALEELLVAGRRFLAASAEASGASALPAQGGLVVQKSGALAEVLLARRHYFRRRFPEPATEAGFPGSPGRDIPLDSIYRQRRSTMVNVAELPPVATAIGFDFDPRFLVCEVQWGLLMRKRQVRLLYQFCTDVDEGYSAVKQMVMGQGKTTVIAPLLCLMLPHLGPGPSVWEPPPVCLQVVPKALLEMSRRVLRSALQSVVHKRIYTLHFERQSTTHTLARVLTTCQAASQHRGVLLSTPATLKSIFLQFLELRLEEQRTGTPPADLAVAVRVLQGFRRMILMMDEVDLLLHPLKSELNFPIGPKLGIDLAPLRWKLPMHLLDLVFRAMAPPSPPTPSAAAPDAAGKLVARFRDAVNTGAAARRVQTVPHLVLLDPAFYGAELRDICEAWLLLWLAGLPLGLTGEGLRGFFSAKALPAGATDEAGRVLRLAEGWLDTYLPHCLGKIHRVSFGLVDPVAGGSGGAPRSRRLLAVPFVGKDAPSPSSEFAHPDVVLGMTLLAYRYDGLRREHLDTLIEALHASLAAEMGPFELRPSYQRYADWVDAAGASLRGRGAGGLEVVSLRLLKRSNRQQMATLFALLRREPGPIHFFLDQLVFPEIMRFQEQKLSACGQELGGSMLFDRRIGFSGTPSDLLPLSLGHCGYEPGADARILHTLTDPEIVDLEVLSPQWTVEAVLRHVASLSGTQACHALIDTGALITGLSNGETAAALLRLGLAHCDGVVFLDANDEKRILVRSSGRVLSLENCGIPPERRFVFYDQTHTTGMDIKHAVRARAGLTLGKDMTLRDYFQGAYRMRGIASGQRVTVYVIPELQERIRADAGATLAPASRDLPPAEQREQLGGLVAWLSLRQLHAERLQAQQLRVQRLRDAFRRGAFDALLAGPDDLALSAFLEDVDFRVHAEPTAPGASLDAQLRRYDKFVARYEHAATITAMLAEPAATAPVVPRLDTETVQEQEQEAEREQQQEQERQVEAEAFNSRASSRLRDTAALWPLAALQGRGDPPPFLALADLALPRSARLAFPRYLSASANFWSAATPMPKRLKNVSLVLEWISGTPQGPGGTTGHDELFRMEAPSQAAVSRGLDYFFTSLEKAPKADAAEVVAEAARRFLHAPPDAPCGEGLKNRAELLAALQGGGGAAVHPQRRFIAVTLAEAATLRFFFHSGRVGDLRLALRNAHENLKILDASARYEAVGAGVDPAWQTRVAAAGWKLWDARLQLSHGDVYSLLQCDVGRQLRRQKQAFLSESLALRRRRHRGLDEGWVRAFSGQRGFTGLFRVELLARLLRAALAAMGVSEEDAFRALDGNADGKVSAEELLAGLAIGTAMLRGVAIDVATVAQWGEAVSPEDVCRLVDLYDREGDGSWGRRDLAAALAFGKDAEATSAAGKAPAPPGRGAATSLEGLAETVRQLTPWAVGAIAAARQVQEAERQAEEDADEVPPGLEVTVVDALSLFWAATGNKRGGGVLELGNDDCLDVVQRRPLALLRIRVEAEVLLRQLPQTLVWVEAVPGEEWAHVFVDAQGKPDVVVISKAAAQRRRQRSRSDAEEDPGDGEDSFLGAAHEKDLPALPGRSQGGLYSSRARARASPANGGGQALRVPFDSEERTGSGGAAAVGDVWRRVCILVNRKTSAITVRVGDGASGGNGLEYVTQGAGGLLADWLSAEGDAMYLFGKPASPRRGSMIEEGLGLGIKECLVQFDHV